MKKVKVVKYINDWVDIDDPACKRRLWKEYWAKCPVCDTECGVTEDGWVKSLCGHFSRFDKKEMIMYFFGTFGTPCGKSKVFLKRKEKSKKEVIKNDPCVDGWFNKNPQGNNYP